MRVGKVGTDDVAHALIRRGREPDFLRSGAALVPGIRFDQCAESEPVRNGDDVRIEAGTRGYGHRGPARRDDPRGARVNEQGCRKILRALTAIQVIGRRADEGERQVVVDVPLKIGACDFHVRARWRRTECERLKAVEIERPDGIARCHIRARAGIAARIGRLHGGRNEERARRDRQGQDERNVEAQRSDLKLARLGEVVRARQIVRLVPRLQVRDRESGVIGGCPR